MVQYMYLTVLCREGEEQGVAGHTQSCEAGRTMAETRDVFLNSDEYQNCDRCKNNCEGKLFSILF